MELKTDGQSLFCVMIESNTSASRNEKKRDSVLDDRS